MVEKNTTNDVIWNFQAFIKWPLPSNDSNQIFSVHIQPKDLEMLIELSGRSHTLHTFHLSKEKEKILKHGT